MNESESLDSVISGKRPALHFPRTIRILAGAFLGLGAVVTFVGNVLRTRDDYDLFSIGEPAYYCGLAFFLAGCLLVIFEQQRRQRLMALAAQLQARSGDGQFETPGNVYQEVLERSPAAETRSQAIEAIPVRKDPIGLSPLIDAGNEMLSRPAAHRGFPLMGLFMLTALCATLIGMIRPVLADLAAESTSVSDFVASTLVASIAASILGMIAGAFDRRPWIGLVWGAGTGAALGLILGPIMLVRAENISSLLITSFQGSLLLLLLALAARRLRKRVVT